VLNKFRRHLASFVTFLRIQLRLGCILLRSCSPV